MRSRHPGLLVLVIMVLFVIQQDQPLWAGLWLGLAVGIVNFHGLATAARKAVWLEKEQAQSYMTRSYIMRYGLRFVVLAAAFLLYDLNPIALLVGLTLPTIAAVVWYFVKTR